MFEAKTFCGVRKDDFAKVFGTAYLCVFTVIGHWSHWIFASLTFFKPFLFLNLHTNYLFYLPYPFLFLLSFQVHTIRKQRRQLYSKALMDEELFEAYLEDKGITRLFQRSSLRLSQPYWS